MPFGAPPDCGPMTHAKRTIILIILDFSFTDYGRVSWGIILALRNLNLRANKRDFFSSEANLHANLAPMQEAYFLLLLDDKID